LYSKRAFQLIPLLVALLFSSSVVLFQPAAAEASTRMREVGGYGIVLRDTSTFAYGSLDSEVKGSARKGEVVYINGWQIGVYHVGDLRWVAASAVQPIIDAGGAPMVNYVTRSGNGYLMNGQPLRLPARRATDAERFLANPPGGMPLVHSASSVGVNQQADLVDPNSIWRAPRQPVVATMRVTGAYGFIHLRTGPSVDAPRAATQAFAHEVLTAYEVRDNQWYRIGENLWAPRTWGNETLLFPENVAAYAPPEYQNGGKWISIDLNRQQLTAWEGDDVVQASRVKTGKYGYHTPTGVFKTWSKQPSARMSGSDYDLLDVSWTQYFTRSGIALHSAYWHNNYNGRPGSHGCVNLPPEQARELFMWAPLGITIVTHNAYQFDAVDIANANRWNQFNR
jgi:hypothetical protein